MKGCSTGVLGEKQRSDNGYNMGPLRENIGYEYLKTFLMCQLVDSSAGKDLGFL